MKDDCIFEIFDHIEPLRRLFNGTTTKAHVKKNTTRLLLDDLLKNKEWREKIPFITWPSEWEIMHLPCCDALLRGVVRLKSDLSRMVSFYLDGEGVLGAVYTYGEEELKPIPYWEIYNISDNMLPNEIDIPERYYLESETDKFIEGIWKMLKGEMKIEED